MSQTCEPPTRFYLQSRWLTRKTKPTKSQTLKFWWILYETAISFNFPDLFQSPIKNKLSKGVVEIIHIFVGTTTSKKKQTIREIHLMYITPPPRPFANAPGEEVTCSRSATCSRFARRLLAVANPAALTSAEAVQDPLAALAFLCPEETSLVEVAWMEMEGWGWDLRRFLFWKPKALWSAKID